MNLRKFQTKNGHCKVPQRPREGEDDHGLGGWVNRVRKDYNKNKEDRTILTDELERELIDLGFEFTNQRKNYSWDEMFEKVEDGGIQEA